MLRRSFLASCAAGTVAVTVANAQQGDSAVRAINALKTMREMEAAGDFNRLAALYHSDALTLQPGILDPLVGRASIVSAARASTGQRKLLYYYYRQPQVAVAGNSALVIANYEAGYESGGKTVEETGKTSNVVLVAPNPPLIALDVSVPNYYGGSSYGPLGTPLSPHYGVFPVRALGSSPAVSATGAGGGENDVLFSEVKKINAAWVAGNADDLLSYGSPLGVFLIGDYSPFYITGTEQIKQHFADFYKTSKVNAISELNPTVRIWGDSAAVSFNFNLDYTIAGRKGQNPGRGVYSFTRGGGAPRAKGAEKRAAAIAGGWRMAACAASHLVLRNVGDPYPTSA